MRGRFVANVTTVLEQPLTLTAIDVRLKAVGRNQTRNTFKAMIFDATDSDFIENPYPVYSELRERDPVHWNPKGFWFLSRYKDVRSCLNDSRLSNRPAPFALVHARNRNRFAAADIANNLIAFLDAPEHSERRNWIAKAFVRSQKEKAAKIAALAEHLATELEDRSQTDFITSFAVPFSCRVICLVIGIPETDAARLASWSDNFFKLFHAIPDAEEFAALNEKLTEFRKYILDLIEAKSKCPGDDLISMLVSSNGWSADRHEIADNVMLLAADGVGNVQSGLSNCAHVLMRHDPVCNFASKSSSVQTRVIDECLRLESPGQYQGRITKVPVELGGKTIRARSIVLLGLASANRDPLAFENADAYLPEEKRRQHLAFGNGPHMCLGSALVRLELTIALKVLFSPERKLSAVSHKRQWLSRPGHRWLKRLHVNFERIK